MKTRSRILSRLSWWCTNNWNRKMEKGLHEWLKKLQSDFRSGKAVNEIRHRLRQAHNSRSRAPSCSSLQYLYIYIHLANCQNFKKAWCRFHHNCSHPPPTVSDHSLTKETARGACDMSIAFLAFLLQWMGWLYRSSIDLTLSDMTWLLPHGLVIVTVFHSRSFHLASLFSF